MFRSLILQFERWLPDLREKLRLDGGKRLLLLLLFFNALLIAILVLSARNIEILRNVRRVEQEIVYRINQLETVQAYQVQIVFITATPTVRAIAAMETPTVLPALATATLTPTQVPTPTSTPMSAATATPTRRPTQTATPTRANPTLTASVSPTAVPTLATATLAWTPTPTLGPTSPTSTPTSTQVPASPTPTSIAPTPTPTPPPVSEPSSMNLTASPANITANGTSTTAIRAEVRDRYGNPVRDGTQVTFVADQGTFQGASSTTASTNGGVAQATLTSSTSVGLATVTATAGSVVGSTQIVFSAGPPYALSLTAQPDRLTVGGTSTLRAVVSDRYGNTVADGTTVQFVTTIGTLSSPNASTSGGTATSTLMSSVAGVATVTAIAGSGTDTVTVQWAPTVQISKAVSRGSAPTGSILSYTIDIQNPTAGGDPALVRTLTDRIPPGFSYVPGSTVSPAFVGDPSIAGQDLTWTASPAPYPLAAGGTLVTTFQVQALAGPGTYYNSAFVAGDNFDPAGSGDTAQVTLLGPTVSSITPNSGCNNAPLNASINGTNFAPGATATLGAWTLTVSWVNESRLDVSVPRDIAAGTYDLTVTNPGGTASTLPQSYTALNCGSLDTTLDSGYLGTYGAEPFFSATQGDDDQVQVLFLEVPEGTSGPLYIRVRDPDCGGNLDIQNGWAWDTPFTFTVYGGSGTYTNPDARSSHPSSGVSSGTILANATFGEDASLDGNWYAFGPFNVGDGEPVNGKRIFKLSVVGGPEPPFLGGSRADLNVYNVALSTSNSTNSAPNGARILAFSWTYLIPAATYNVPPRMFPYVASGVTTLTQRNWDFDNSTFGPGTAGITMVTPERTITVPNSAVSGDNEGRSSDHPTSDGERNTTWAISCWAEPTGALGENLVTFWATDQSGATLAIFARSTIYPPP